MVDVGTPYDMGMRSDGNPPRSPRRLGMFSCLTARLIGRTKFNTLPPACPQKRGEFSDGYSQSEDCLYAVIYTPLHTAPNSNMPVFTW